MSGNIKKKVRGSRQLKYLMINLTADLNMYTGTNKQERHIFPPPFQTDYSHSKTSRIQLSVASLRSACAVHSGYCNQRSCSLCYTHVAPMFQLPWFSAQGTKCNYSNDSLSSLPLCHPYVSCTSWKCIL